MAKVTFTIHKAGKHQRHSRRNQILDAAQRCFKKQGFHKTTLRDIAQEFGMSAGHIYNYFSNKSMKSSWPPRARSATTSSRLSSSR